MAIVQTRPGNSGSLTLTFVMVTLPVLVTLKVYVSRSPAESAVETVALSSVQLGVAAIRTVLVSVASASVPFAGVPVAVAVLTTWPLSTSAWVAVYVAFVAVQLAVAPGATVAIVHTSVGSSGSLTDTLSIVTLPVLVTEKV